MSQVALRILPGLTPYAEAWALQLDLAARRRQGECADTLLLLEHPPVITLGRNADAAGVTAPPSLLERLGIPVFRIERGGQATYHGPGQVVGYPILDLRALRLGAAAYVHRLEEVMRQAARAFGVEARRREKVIGLFTDQGKLGAIGVRIAGGVSLHGFAFNVNPDLDHFRLIVPCGMPEMPATSLAKELGEAPGLARVQQELARGFEEAFGLELAVERDGGERPKGG